MDSTTIDTRTHHQPHSATSSTFSANGSTLHLLATPGSNEPRSLYHVNQSILLPNLSPFSPSYTQLLASAFPGPGVEGIDLDAMKVSHYWLGLSRHSQRALDTSSLPANPMNGQQPHIDPTSSFDTLSPKKARYEPVYINGFPTPAPDAKPFTPGQSMPYVSSHSYVQNGVAPQSPLNLGGPLSTPAQTSSMGAAGVNGLNVPQSPFMGMINGSNGVMGMQGFGMGAFPFSMNMVCQSQP